MYLILSFFFSAAQAAPPVSLEYKSSQRQYRLELNDHEMKLSSPALQFTTEITNCNREWIQGFWRNLQKQVHELRAGDSRQTATRVTINGRSYTPVLGTRASMTLQGAVDDAAMIYAANSLRCTKGRAPASEEKVAQPARVKVVYPDDPEGKCLECKWQKTLERKDVFGPLKACVQDICRRSAAKLPDLIKESKEVLDLQTNSPALKEFDQNLGTQFSQLSRKMRELNIASLEKFKKLLDHPPADITDNDSMAFYDYFANKMGKNLRRVDREKDGKVQTVFSARSTTPAWDNPIDKVYETFTPQDIEATLDYWNWFHENIGKSEKTLDSTMAEIRATVGNEGSDQEAAKRYARQIQTRAEALLNNNLYKGHSRESLLPLINFNEVDRVAATGDIPYSDLERLIYSSKRLVLHEAYAKSPELRKRSLEYAKLILKDPKRVNLIREDIDQQIENQKTNLNKNLMGVSFCRESYAVKIAKAPIQKQIDAGMAREKNLRQNFASQILARFSEETRNRVKQKMADWRLEYPPTAGQIKSELKRNVDQNLDWVGRLQANPDPNMTEWLENDVATFCKDQQEGVRPLYDAALTTTGRVLVSREATKYAAVGTPVIGHEFGHMLAQQFKDGNTSEHSSKIFKQVRQCLSAKHKLEPETEMEIQGEKIKESKLAEEDWADLNGELAKPSPGENIWCVLFKGEILPQDLSFYEQSDVHSTGFFRLLHLQQLRTGKLPENCSKGLQAGGIDVDFKRCL